MARKISIKDLNIVLDRLNDAVNVAGDDITKYTSDILVDEISERYDVFKSSLGDDPQDRSDTSITTQRLSTGKYRVDVSGSQVIYDEFGTGLPGKLSPHPLKGQFSLDDYLSGKTIRYPKKGGLPYWTFDRKYTHGVPSGQFIYRSAMDLENAIDYQVMSNLIYNRLNKVKK